MKWSLKNKDASASTSLKRGAQGGFREQPQYQHDEGNIAKDDNEFGVHNSLTTIYIFYNHCLFQAKNKK